MRETARQAARGGKWGYTGERENVATSHRLKPSVRPQSYPPVNGARRAARGRHSKSYGRTRGRARRAGKRGYTAKQKRGGELPRPRSPSVRPSVRRQPRTSPRFLRLRRRVSFSKSTRTRIRNDCGLPFPSHMTRIHHPLGYPHKAR